MYQFLKPYAYFTDGWPPKINKNIARKWHSSASEVL